MKISMVLNGMRAQFDVRPDETLLEVIRERAGLTGTKKGCDLGECGACTVLMDGRAVNSCCIPAAMADGTAVITIEGLASGKKHHLIQEAFAEAGAIQCGFCTPGMILSAKALLDAVQHPSRGEIREALSGNLCRCTGYVKIEEAVRRAAEMMEAAAEADSAGKYTEEDR